MSVGAVEDSTPEGQSLGLVENTLGNGFLAYSYIALSERLVSLG